MQAASFSCLRAILPHVSLHLIGPKSLLGCVLRTMSRARKDASSMPAKQAFLVQVRIAWGLSERAAASHKCRLWAGLPACSVSWVASGLGC